MHLPDPEFSKFSGELAALRDLVVIVIRHSPTRTSTIMEFRRRAQDVETAVASQRDEQWAIYPTRTSGYSLSFSIACVRMRLATLARNARKDAPRERQTDKLPNGGKCDWAPGIDALARKVAVEGVFNRDATQYAGAYSTERL